MATAELTWREPGSSLGSAPRRLRQPVSRLQFATSPEEMPASLQAAALAAEAAEILRESPFAGSRNRDLRSVIEASRRAHRDLRESASFRRFVDVLHGAEQARKNRNRDG